jgi:toluene monooxygenase system ferredoxin subunit
MPLCKVADCDALWSGEMLGSFAGGCRVLLVNHEGVLYAYHDRCPHLGVPLSKGRLHGDVLTCSAHEWQYDVRTGRGINPRCAALETLPIEVKDGAVWVRVKGTSGAGG